MNLHGLLKDQHGQLGPEAQLGKALQPGETETPAPEVETPEIVDDQQYKGEEVKKILRTALSADGRTQKDRADKAEKEVTRVKGELTGLTTQVTGLTTEIGDFRKSRDAAEREAVKDDAPALASLSVIQANRDESARLAALDRKNQTDRTQIETDQTEIAKGKAEITAFKVAQEVGVDHVKLFELIPDGDPERLKSMAKVLKDSGVTGTPAGEKKPAGLGVKPASPVSAGGGETGIRQIIDKAKKRAGVNT